MSAISNRHGSGSRANRHAAKQSRPSCFETLESRQLLSCVVDIRLTGGGKSIQATSVGQIIPMQVWAVVTGKDSTGANDGVQSVTGSFLSTMTSSGGVHGNLTAAPLSPFQADGAQYGKTQDLNGDGNIDVGSNDNSTITGFWNARDGQMDTSGTVQGASQEFLLGTLNYTVTSLASGQETDVNFRLRNIPSNSLGYAAVWQEDGQIADEQDHVFSIGAPVKITGPTQQQPPPAQLTGTVIGTSGSYQNNGNTIAKVFDGNLSTFFDAPGANGNWAGLDLGSAANITQISYAPRSGFANRMVGGVFQASNSANFSSGVVTLYTVTTAPPANTLTTVNINVPGGYRYVRYLSPNGSYGNIAEMKVFGQPAVVIPPPQQLSGSVIGTSGSYQNNGNTIAKVFDGNLSTFFDAPSANGNWAGLDLGSAASITQISYAPRSGYANRMVGGIFQVSNTADFSSGVVNLYTITTAPPSNTFTTINVNPSGTFRYVRYLSPNGSYGNIAEMQVFGTSSAPTRTQLTGSVIGTSGSYQNNGNTIAKVFDGNLSTFFDAPSANGNWAGLDLGSAASITQISYAPRSGFANRMVGGVFQASNTADFSSGVVSLYTITTAPPANTFTTVTVNAAGTYRYVRYLSPNGSYGNIAELQFWS